MDKIQSKGGMQHIKSPFQENKNPFSLNIVTVLHQNVELNILSFKKLKIYICITTSKKTKHIKNGN